MSNLKESDRQHALEKEALLAKLASLGPRRELRVAQLPPPGTWRKKLAESSGPVQDPPRQIPQGMMIGWDGELMPIPKPKEKPVEPLPVKAVMVDQPLVAMEPQAKATDGMTPQQRWKQKNAQKMRDRHREYMKEYRAKKK